MVLNNNDLDNSGIYFIKNIVTNKIYIGQAVNIRKRFNCHKHMLRENKHDNIHLQRSWNKHGSKKFQFGVLEFCDRDKLNEMETDYIKLYQSNNIEFGYNMSSGGDSPLYNQEHVEKMRRVRTEIAGKSVVQYDVDGNFVAEFDSFNDAARKNKISVQSVANSVNKQIITNEKIFISKDCIFDVNTYLVNSKLYNPILQYDLDGNYIREYNQLSEVQLYGFKKHQVYNCCVGKIQSYNGFVFTYKNDHKNIDFDNIKLNILSKRVIQLDKNGKFINEFDTFKMAQRDTGICNMTVSKSIKQNVVECDYLFVRGDIYYNKDFDFKEYKTNLKPTNRNRRKVGKYTTTNRLLQTYDSILQAAKENNLNHRTIGECCIGHRKTHGGFVWKYLD
jgi:hypothetical protein